MIQWFSPQIVRNVLGIRRSSSVRRTLLGFILIVGAGCGGKEKQQGATEVVGAAGGMVSLVDATGVVTVEIPPAALPGDANVSIVASDASPPTPPQGRAWVGTVFEIGPPGTQFGSPVSVTLPFLRAKEPVIVNDDQLVVYAAASLAGPYEALPTVPAYPTCSSCNDHVVATTTHFSFFAVTASDGSCFGIRDSPTGNLCPGPAGTSVNLTYSCTGPCVGSGSVTLVPATSSEIGGFSYGTNTNPSGGSLVSGNLKNDMNTELATVFIDGVPAPQALPFAYAWCHTPPEPPPTAPKPLGAHLNLEQITLPLSCTYQGVTKMFNAVVYVGGRLGSSSCGASLCTECDSLSPHPTASFSGAFSCAQAEGSPRFRGVSDRNC